MRRYQPGRWHRYLASKLERVERGECKRLIITVPPRHGKSEQTSVRFPAFYLGHHPERFVILASYGAELARGFGAQVKDVVDSAEFGRLFPSVSLAPHRRKNNLWRIAGHGGGMTTAGVGGPITGFGAHLLIIDDPIKNDDEANSATRRQKLLDWYKAVAYTRLEDDAAVVLIMTRWHQGDLVGELRKQMEEADGEKWEVLDLPAIAEEDEEWEGFGQRQKGAALWPEKYDLPALERIRKAVGEYWWASLYQQKPRVLSGGILDSKGLMRIEKSKLPPMAKTVRYWDLAFSDRGAGDIRKGGADSRKGSADAMAGALCGIDAMGRFYILDIVTSRAEWPAHFRKIQQTAESDGPMVEVIVEANGTQLGYYQQVRDALRNRVVRKGIPDGNKEMRARLWGSRLEDGIVFCVVAAWNEGFFAEMDDFPRGAHDDRIDGVSGAWARLVARPSATVNSE
jgi:predicted phage terminase large subunit-like protein